jgi:hypothetical protein
MPNVSEIYWNYFVNLSFFCSSLLGLKMKHH